MGHYQPPPGLKRFSEIVFDDPELQRRLRSRPSRADFIGRVVAEAAARGCAVTPREVEGALAGARRAWLERWI